MNLRQLLDRLKEDQSHSGCITAWESLPARPARHGPWPAGLVIDEIHNYRGVFGSHVANVLRRLDRICRFYGARPTFICCSATIGNPGELAGRLCEGDFEVIDDDGAPRGPRAGSIGWSSTDANLAVDLRVLDVFDTATDGFERARGEASVTALATIFKKIKLHTHENVGSGHIRLPEQRMHTQAAWLALPPEITAGIGRPELEAGPGAKGPARLILDRLTDGGGRERR